MQAAEDGLKQELKAQQRKNLLYGGLSNEIAGPVNVILNAAEILKKRFEDQQELQETIGAIEDNIRALDRLGTNLLDMVGFLSGGNTPFLQPVDLRGQLCYLLEQSEPYARRQGIALHWQPDGMPELYPFCDTVMLDGILLRLLSNAIRFGRPGGGIWVEVEAGQGGPAAILVRDDGPGIAPELLELVFDPLSPREGSGVVFGCPGMGLYLAREACRAMGWRLCIESGSGGTLARVEIAGHTPGPLSPVVLSSDAIAAHLLCEERQRRVEREMAALFGPLDKDGRKNG